MAQPVKDKTKYRVLREIVEHDKTHSYGISLDEISASLGLSGRPAVHYHVQILKEEGMVKQEIIAKRNLRPTLKGKVMVEVMYG